MEAFILFIIMGIIGSLMSKNKEKQQKPMPPFNNKPDTTRYKPTPQQRVEPTRSQRTAKSLEDFAKEVFEQLNEKNNQPQDIFTVPETKEVVVEPKVSHSNVNNPESTVTKSVPRNRPTFDENRSSKKYDKPLDNDVIKQNEIGSYVPSTKQALIQAIVASEIIGPPKAKQR